MARVIVIGASEGGLEPLRRIVATLPIPCPAAVFVVLHTGAHPTILPDLLDRPGLRASFARDGANIKTSHIYVPPPDCHMLLEAGRVRVTQGPKIHYTRPAADPLFISAAEAHGADVMGIVLSGRIVDGAIGLKAIKARGGVAIVQLPKHALKPAMPEAALAVANHEALPVVEIARRAYDFCS